ncbi:MAG: sulfurtransferase [Deltaproteobacteria bacterium]|nr:sulfurtransferase [Deltaproteobacteria bacterium]
MADSTHDRDFEALCDDARTRIREMSVGETWEAMQEPQPILLVDVREDREWAVDRCAGAVHLGRGVIERDIHQLAPDKATPMVLYCGGGFRSALAADNLRRMGYRDVRSMAGGIRAWRAEGLPLEAGDQGD